MDDLLDLYQEIILDHNKKPRNFREPEHADHKADGFNPLCGDKITVYLVLDGDIVRDVAFKGSGCAISTASASLMTEAVKGKTVDEARELFRRFHDMATGDPTQEPDDEGLGKLAALAGVREYPMRVKCATLAWHTLTAALDGEAEAVSTE